ncbi:hypothetical protein P9181_10370 [Bacillus velezensis]|uniref:hypothetical protein n=1 Tax=Bacillus velezensis TaxID=492670 RepID=UPI00255B7BF1|nr:hypothetical protein [Bacillus velezensis]MDL5021776.1 hypothetical protein [Bacillus velezensis]MEC3611742.1 hypothetical protein [Bacillus velezensis]MEC3678855.1 hypothetical protein [Bacillus velezensis]
MKAPALGAFLFYIGPGWGGGIFFLEKNAIPSLEILLLPVNGVLGSADLGIFDRPGVYS